jgi:hypothetical protein
MINPFSNPLNYTAKNQQALLAYRIMSIPSYRGKLEGGEGEGKREEGKREGL